MSEHMVRPDQPSTAATKSISQTLDRGLRVLEILSEDRKAMTVAQLTAELRVDRAVTYRILRTLVAHRLVVRDGGGQFRLATGALSLAAGVSRDLQAAARPELTALANELGATAFLAVEEEGEIVCLTSVEPARSYVHVVYRPGLRHALDRGASGIALLAGRPPVSDERPEVTNARCAGFAVSEGEIQPATLAVAAPILSGEGPAVASVAIVALAGDSTPDDAAPRVVEAAQEIAKALG